MSMPSDSRAQRSLEYRRVMQSILDGLAALLVFVMVVLAAAFALLVLNATRSSKVSRACGAALGIVLTCWALWQIPETITRIRFVHPTEGHRFRELFIVLVPLSLGLAHV